MKDLIKKYPNVYIELNYIEKTLKKPTPEILKEIFALIKSGDLETTKSSKKTGLYFQNGTPVPSKFKIIKKENIDYINEFKNYNYKLNLDYYKKSEKKEEYFKDKKNIEKISNYLNNQNTLNIDNIPLSINERSFEIFGNEKFILSDEGLQLFKNLKISLELLNIYRTPEPFLYFKNQNCNNENILIIENKDTFYTMKNILSENKKIMGLNFNAIIYGEGRKIQQSFDGISLEQYKDFNNKNNNFYYFGDIDSDGIDILYKLKQNYQNYNIIPFYNGYNFLLKNEGKRRYKDDKKGKLINFEILKEIFIEFNEEKNNLIFEICNSNYILPQEILNNKELRKV